MLLTHQFLPRRHVVADAAATAAIYLLAATPHRLILPTHLLSIYTYIVFVPVTSMPLTPCAPMPKHM